MSEELLEELLVELSHDDQSEVTEGTLKAIIVDINALAPNEAKGNKNLVEARRWRFTSDYPSLAPNRNISQNFAFIERTLLPILKQKGVVHSYIKQDDIFQYGINIRKYWCTSHYNYIVQF